MGRLVQRPPKDDRPDPYENLKVGLVIGTLVGLIGLVLAFIFS